LFISDITLHGGSGARNDMQSGFLRVHHLHFSQFEIFFSRRPGLYFQLFFLYLAPSA
jgi:hypothetical protein